MMHFHEGQYGFEWGAARVERIGSDAKRGFVILRTGSARHPIEIYVTKMGRVRVFDVDGCSTGKEWKRP